MVKFSEGGIALISVSDKVGIETFAQGITQYGFPNIVSTGNTSKVLKEAGVNVIEVSDITEWEEMLSGRVKTLHPKIHGGILADLDKQEHMDTLDRFGIPLFGLVCIDMYPLAATISRPGSTMDDVIANTDIGGPTMLAGAAKGKRIVLSRAEQRPVTVEWLKNGRPNDEAFRGELMMAAFQEVVGYYPPIERYLGAAGLTGELARLEELSAVG